MSDKRQDPNMTDFEKTGMDSKPVTSISTLANTMNICRCLLRTPGDWLVRSTDSRDIPEIIISVRVKGKKKDHSHLTLRFENNKWVLGAFRRKAAPHFDTVVDLVEYYKEHGLPGHILMKTPIPRPKWLIKHDMCKFDMLKDLIGTGNFCNVYRGTYEREKNYIIPVAIKICHGASSETITEEAKQARESMIHEAQLMSYYVHKHVIQLYGVACDHYPVMIVMEYCPGGNLQEHMQKYKHNVTAVERVALCYEAAKGMRYLHSKGCVHRDLAARNCLISDDGLKISDFGLSKIAEELKPKRSADEKEDPSIEHIPLRWMAPETLRRPQLWSTKSDVWSFGVLLYEVFNDGERPWPNDEPKRIATHIRHGRMPDLPPKTPEKIRRLITEIWSMNPEERPTMNKLAKKLCALHRGEFKIKDRTLLTIKKGVKNKMESCPADETESIRYPDTKSMCDDNVTERALKELPSSRRSKPPRTIRV